MRIALFCLANAMLAATTVPLAFEPVARPEVGACEFVSHVPQGAVCAAANRLLFTFSDEHEIFSGSIEFEGARIHPLWEPMQAGGSTTYAGGAYTSLRGRALTHYRRIIAHELYPGIDLIIYGTAGLIEYDFQVAPGADPSRIRLAAHGGRYELLE